MISAFVASEFTTLNPKSETPKPRCLTGIPSWLSPSCFSARAFVFPRSWRSILGRHARDFKIISSFGAPIWFQRDVFKHRVSGARIRVLHILHVIVHEASKPNKSRRGMDFSHGTSCVSFSRETYTCRM